MTTKKLCVFHTNCADGFGAAWVVRKALGADNVEFHPGVYQEPPPNVDGRDVIIVDFSYKRPVLLEMAKRAKSILIIDHHKSAAEDLAGLGTVVAGTEMAGGNPCPIETVFDMEHSGAMLTWLYFFPGMEPPALLHHIEDRDLWRFAIEGTREIQANLFSYPYDFDVWTGLMQSDPNGLRADGTAIERKHFKDINEFIAAAAYYAVIGGFEVPILNAPYFWSSDAGHIMAKGHPFAACYWDVPDGRQFSLRSTEDGIDVSDIAKQYGGGGHKHAAGFKIPHPRTMAYKTST